MDYSVCIARDLNIIKGAHLLIWIYNIILVQFVKEQIIFTICDGIIENINWNIVELLF